MTTAPRRRARPLTPVEAGRAVWDLVVVGAGSAGLVAARTAAVLGARVLLIEARGFGGECLYTGCVPSKALIAAADAAQDARGAGRLGIHVDEVRVDFAAVMAHVKRAIAEIEPVDSPETLAGSGVFTLRGRARFDGPRSLVVEGVGIRFRDAILATGSSPVVPDGVDVLTNETVWDLESLPESLLVLGGARSAASWRRRSRVWAVASRSSTAATGCCRKRIPTPAPSCSPPCAPTASTCAWVRRSLRPRGRTAARRLA